VKLDFTWEISTTEILLCPPCSTRIMTQLRVRKNCGKTTPHSFTDCTCTVCGATSHDWKFVQRTESAGIGCSAFMHYKCALCGEKKADSVR
jgi:DNA-directed RNA polymerase subunit RPC12/RpoP